MKPSPLAQMAVVGCMIVGAVLAYAIMRTASWFLLPDVVFLFAAALWAWTKGDNPA